MSNIYIKRLVIKYIILKTKCNDFCNRLDEIEVNEELCEDVTEKLENLREFLSFSERKPNKERNKSSYFRVKLKRIKFGL